MSSLLKWCSQFITFFFDAFIQMLVKHATKWICPPQILWPFSWSSVKLSVIHSQVYAFLNLCLPFSLSPLAITCLTSYVTDKGYWLVKTYIVLMFKIWGKGFTLFILDVLCVLLTNSLILALRHSICSCLGELVWLGSSRSIFSSSSYKFSSWYKLVYKAFKTSRSRSGGPP